MLTTYRRVLGLPGALVFSLSGLVARLPISMVSLGIVLLVSTRTGSYGLAGTVSASFLIANALVAVVQARLVDRWGQSRVLPAATATFAIGLLAMMAAIEVDAPPPVPHLFAVLAGAGMPQIGSCVRARWAQVVPDKATLQTAFAFEAVADETVFIVGPALVTVLATTVHPLAGLGAAVVASVGGTTVFLLQKRTEPRPSRRPAGHAALPMPWGVLVPLAASGFCMGMLLGGAEVATVAFSDEHGSKALSGLLLAVWALGSLISGAVTGALTLRAAPASRFRWGMLALTLLMLPLPFLDSFPLLAVFLFLSGFAVSPTLIASLAWVEQVVPGARLTEGITLFITGLGAGVAPGAAVVGRVVDASGASASFWVSVAAGAAGTLVAFATAAVARSTTAARPSPSGSSS